mmetsp:Transcript_55236/g.131885  ORF Transcript_55236/g.131885 Transcript_55236/m.131885 type:complete len:221 (+) Transcript_55236:1329-1991(+)
MRTFLTISIFFARSDTSSPDATAASPNFSRAVERPPLLSEATRAPSGPAVMSWRSLFSSERSRRPPSSSQSPCSRVFASPCHFSLIWPFRTTRKPAWSSTLAPTAYVRTVIHFEISLRWPEENWESTALSCIAFRTRLFSKTRPRSSPRRLLSSGTEMHRTSELLEATTVFSHRALPPESSASPREVPGPSVARTWPSTKVPSAMTLPPRITRSSPFLTK